MLGIADARTVDLLETHQLDTAAADLRNAGLVVKHAGHFRNALVSRIDGSVCALGAIQLATFKRLAKISATGEFTPLSQSAYSSDLSRADNAVLVFADTLPNNLCDICSVSTEYPGDASCHVTHYNDRHCASGETLVTLLNRAADKAQTLAADRRSLTRGLALAGV